MNSKPGSDMPTPARPNFKVNWRRTKGETVGIILLGVLMLAGYIWFLNHQEARAEKYFQALRRSAPDTYLNEIRQVSGFEFYLTEYAALKGFDKYRSLVPDFMIGRWSLVDAPKRVSDSYEAVACPTSLLFENGRVTFPSDQPRSQPAQFRLDRKFLDVKQTDGTVIAVRLVSSGVHLHHIELTLSGGDAVVYGYTCK